MDIEETAGQGVTAPLGYPSPAGNFSKRFRIRFRPFQGLLIYKSLM